MSGQRGEHPANLGTSQQLFPLLLMRLMLRNSVPLSVCVRVCVSQRVSDQAKSFFFLKDLFFYPSHNSIEVCDPVLFGCNQMGELKKLLAFFLWAFPPQKSWRR